MTQTFLRDAFPEGQSHPVSSLKGQHPARRPAARRRDAGSLDAVAYAPRHKQASPLRRDTSWVDLKARWLGKLIDLRSYLDRLIPPGMSKLLKPDR